MIEFEIPLPSDEVLDLLFGAEFMRGVRAERAAIDAWESEGGAL